MKAHEVLKRYGAGGRDFSGENLKGQSFKGKDLSGANFTQADIRGTNFTNAILIGANFRGAKAGLQSRWAEGLFLASLIFSWLSAAFLVFLGYVVALIFHNDISNVIAGWVTLIALAIFFIVTIRKGLVAGLGIFFVAVTGAVAVAVVVTGGGSRAGTGAGTLFVAVGEAGAIRGAGYVVGAVGGAVGLLGAYISWRALKGDERDAWIRSIAIALAATGGTSFRDADLTDADFTSATLKSTDFRNATLTRTRWHQAKKLDRIRPGTTYLQFPQVRQLLITGQGQAQNFDRQPLRGVNLQGANLADASFIGADLSEANLQDADLSRAKLVQTQLDETDLTGATLTGAYIEDWGITSHTKLDGVRCEYVFMRVPTKEDPNPRRKPDNWNETFKDGDFADFIKPIVDTLDLYHNQDVDPRAIAISFKELAENHPEAGLEIVAMEKRGENKFLLRTATALDANHSELNAEYFDTYNKVKALAERELQALLKEKDNRIHSLETMIATALQRPSFYAENYHNQGHTMPENPNNEYNFHGSVGSVANQGKIGSSGNENTIGNTAADVKGDQKSIQHNYNYTPEQRQTLAEAAAEIQQLLKQLEQTNPTATEVEQKAFLTAVIPATKRERFVNALQEGGKELFKELMDNMYVNVAVAAIEGWQSAE
jgi:uncharacterized protein YjbI with pentapeptide repeats